MEKSKMLRKDYLDILFEGRNKAYGGYELRRKYALRARKACIGVVLGVAVAATIPVIAASLSRTERTIPPVTITCGLTPPPVYDKPKEEIPVHVVEPPKQVATIRAPELKIVRDEFVHENPVTVEEVKNKSIGLVTNDSGDIDPTLVATTKGGGGKGIIESSDGDGDGKPQRFVEQMPEFEGSLEAYLRKNLHYPDEARANGIEGRVGIQFVVNEDGSISSAEVFNRASALLDAEALRVVKAMPKWKPGRQEGKAVKCYFTLPITFTLF
jgi:protein TonB